MSTDESIAADPGKSSQIILTINGGSSSIKFAAFSTASPPTRFFRGQVERVGTPKAFLTATRDPSTNLETRQLLNSTFDGCVQALTDYLRERVGKTTVMGIGHRVVQGGVNLLDHQVVTAKVIAELRRMQPIDQAHLPSEIALIERFAEAFPDHPQIACFDTAFHRNLPRVAQLLPIPRRYLNAGVRRFGFHGLSYTYLLSELGVQAGEEIANRRVILAHLGSGASMTAVRDGKPIDTTMAFTPMSGLVMGTRPGDLDPGLLTYLMKEESLSPDAMNQFISQQCGMLGVSEGKSDMRDLLAARATDPHAADAVELFIYEARKHLCALTATLGGLDTIVFAGGVGEHAPEIRADICAELGFLGLDLDASKNTLGSGVISTDQSRVTVRIIPTDEEVVIARTVLSLLGQT